jgi:hypothetical protein
VAQLGEALEASALLQEKLAFPKHSVSLNCFDPMLVVVRKELQSSRLVSFQKDAGSLRWLLPTLMLMMAAS